MPRTSLVVLALVAVSARAQMSSEEERKWNEPVEPFRIAGAIYYVCAAEVSSYLIATPRGHIIIDSGFAETAPMVLRNVAKLGFDARDVKIILNTHAHYDHAGGLAALRSSTGATLMVSERDAPLLARGGLADPQFGDRFRFTPVAADRLLRDGDNVSLGGVTLTAHMTPGHTPGCTTWTTTVRDKLRRYDVVLVCSASVPSQYKLTNNPNYPDAIDDYRRTFATLKSLPCDIFLAPHGSFFKLLAKRERHVAGVSPNPFVDPAGCASYVSRAEAAFEQAVKREADAAAH